MLTRILLLAATNLRAALGRPAATLTLVAGTAVVAGVATSVASLARGLSLQFADAGAPNRAVVLASDAASFQEGSLTPEQVEFVHQAASAMQAAGVDRVGETYAQFAARGIAPPSLVPIRGITPQGIGMRPDIRIVAGRMLEPGRHEAVVGAHIAARFREAGIGDRIVFALGHLDVVGTFESGDHLDSLVLVDFDTVFGGRLCNAVVVELDSPGLFDAFRASLNAHSTLDFGVRRESDYYNDLGWIRSESFRRLGLAIGAIMVIGGVLCSTNVTVSVLAGRSSETATLRAIGFPSSSIAASILLEVLAMVAAGAGVGAVASWALLDGALVRAAGAGATAFQPAYDGWTLFHGLAWAMASMVLGAVVAMFRSLRREIREDVAGDR